MGRWRKTKRSCYRRLPNIFKPTPSPAQGFELSQLTIIRAIGVPLIIVAADVVTDGNLLFDMNSYIDTLIAINTSSNSTYDNVTELHNSTTSTETANQQKNAVLVSLCGASSCILVLSVLNLIFGNPAKTLIRNVRTTVLMGTRELESKDVPVPIGDYLQYFDKSLDSVDSKLISRPCSRVGFLSVTFILFYIYSIADNIK